MACVEATTSRAALNEATDRWPHRNRASDGICSSPQHRKQNSNSDHDTGDAFDLTHDPEGGVNCHALVRRLVRREDPRVKYIIWDRQIWRSYKWHDGHPEPWTPEEYRGSNPHTRHMHVSIYRDYRDDTRTWWGDWLQEDDVEILVRGEGDSTVYQTNGREKIHLSGEAIKLRKQHRLVRADGPGSWGEYLWPLEEVERLETVGQTYPSSE